jgi:hypothetical protein
MFKRFTVGLAVGYVLGARAGDKRYKQIASLAEKASEWPTVNRVLESGRDFANDRGHDLLDDVKRRAAERLDGMFGRDSDDQRRGDRDRQDRDPQDRDPQNRDPQDDDDDEPSANGHAGSSRRARPSGGRGRRPPSKQRLGEMAAAAVERGRVD